MHLIMSDLTIMLIMLDLIDQMELIGFVLLIPVTLDQVYQIE